MKEKVMAAKEETVGCATGAQQHTPEEMAAQATKVLNNALESEAGLALVVDGTGWMTLRKIEATKVVVGDVSVFFTIGVYAFRTKSASDRQALLEGNAFAIAVVQIRGPKPSPTEEREPVKRPFAPRSAWRRSITSVRA